ncbi:MAG: hypothetical protein WAQ98_15310 [Blastocatellia bacterium]
MVKEPFIQISKFIPKPCSLDTRSLNFSTKTFLCFLLVKGFTNTSSNSSILTQESLLKATGHILFS